MDVPIPREQSETQPSLLQEWGWNESVEMPASAYIHVPFCKHRCGYCNFSLLADRPAWFDRFLGALERELAELQIPRAVETLFIGGGTPSVLPAKQMIRLLEMLSKWLPLEAGGEWTMECNPTDVNQDLCDLLAFYGLTRISLGGQSFQPHKLKVLERDHSPQQLKAAIELAQNCFPSVSVDLIFAAPNESLADWRRDVDLVRELELHHVSTYGLTYEKGSKFWGLRERNLLEPVVESLELDMYMYAIDTLTGFGLQHYEVSSFASPGHSCRHNQAYWNGTPWWAFGPSAARFVGGVRSVNHRGTLEYIRRIESSRSALTEREQLTEEQQTREKFVFGMRQMEGVPWAELSLAAPEHVVQSIENAINLHIQHGWIERVNNRIRLTRKGLLISDGLWDAYL